VRKAEAERHYRESRKGQLTMKTPRAPAIEPAPLLSPLFLVLTGYQGAGGDGMHDEALADVARQSLQ
jgi:hypothetical protein